MSRALALMLCAGAALAPGAPARAADVLSMDEQGLTFEAHDVKLTLGGRVHVDAVNYEDPQDDSSTVDFRRARLDLSGSVGRNFRFRAERELAHGGGWRNLWAAYRPAPPVELRAGNFNVPFSLEELQSSDRIPFLERSLVSSLSPSMGLGAAASYSGRRWTASAGYFGDALGTDPEASQSRGEGWVARVTALPISEGDRFVHVGGALERRTFDPGDTARFRAGPGAAFTPRLLSTGTLRNPDSLASLGGEAAVSMGRVLLQGQYVTTRLSRDDAPSLRLDAWYAQAGWLVVGRRYGYSARSGAPSGPQLRRNPAVELAARYSRADFNDGAFSRGVGETVTIGANLYISPNVRLMADYIHAETHDFGRRDDESADIAAVRAQISY